MPIVDVIDCKLEKATKAYLFTPFMSSKSTTAGNINVFEDLNIDQLGLKKENLCWSELLTLWWGNLKTEVQMQGMKAHGIEMDRAYN